MPVTPALNRLVEESGKRLFVIKENTPDWQALTCPARFRIVLAFAHWCPPCKIFTPIFVNEMAPPLTSEPLSLSSEGLTTHGRETKESVLKESTENSIIWCAVGCEQKASFDEKVPGLPDVGFPTVYLLTGDNTFVDMVQGRNPLDFFTDLERLVPGILTNPDMKYLDETLRERAAERAKTHPQRRQAGTVAEEKKSSANASASASVPPSSLSRNVWVHRYKPELEKSSYNQAVLGLIQILRDQHHVPWISKAEPSLETTPTLTIVRTGTVSSEPPQTISCYGINAAVFLSEYLATLDKAKT